MNFIFAGLSVVAFSGHAARAQHDGPPPEVQAAFDACHLENKIAKPVPGERPSAADRKKIDDCMTAKGFPPPPPRNGDDPMIREQLDACVEETKVPRLRDGEHPTDADRAKVEACMRSKGFNPPSPPPAELKTKTK